MQPLPMTLKRSNNAAVPPVVFDPPAGPFTIADAAAAHNLLPVVRGLSHATACFFIASAREDDLWQGEQQRACSNFISRRGASKTTEELAAIRARPRGQTYHCWRSYTDCTCTFGRAYSRDMPRKPAVAAAAADERGDAGPHNSQQAVGGMQQGEGELR